MKISVPIAALALLAATPAWAQTGAPAPQPRQGEIVIMKVDTVRLASAYRGSKVIGATVRNDANETVGKVDDIIIRPDDRVLFAVLSVGGFLGMGDRLVVVPYEQLRFDGEDKAVLAGATKEGLKQLPEFKYRAGG